MKKWGKFLSAARKSLNLWFFPTNPKNFHHPKGNDMSQEYNSM